MNKSKLWIQILAWTFILVLPWQMALSRSSQEDAQSYFATLGGKIEGTAIFSQSEKMKTYLSQKSKTFPTTSSTQTDPQSRVEYDYFLDFSEDKAMLETLIRSDMELFSSKPQTEIPDSIRANRSCESAWQKGHDQGSSGSGFIFTHQAYRNKEQQACENFRLERKSDELQCCLKGFLNGAEDLTQKALKGDPSLCLIEYALGRDDARVACETGQCRSRDPKNEKLLHPGCYAHGYLKASIDYSGEAACAGNSELRRFISRIDPSLNDRAQKDLGSTSSGEFKPTSKGEKSGVGQ